VRFTLTRHNAPQVPAIFDLVRDERIDRLCFYHLVYSGRGSKLKEWDLGPQETRDLMDLIFHRTRELNRNGVREVMTVDNHADSVYLYLSLREGEPGRAEDIYRELLKNGGNSSGVGIGAIDERGGVHPDQFWRHYSLGNVRERPFSQIWEDPSQPLLQTLRERRKHLTGRCGLCRYQELCGGNFRVRAEAVHGDIWAPDPACYLSDQEIGLA
jgi:radical SAM protein with 4Fe4S-binding SPASM domain